MKFYFLREDFEKLTALIREVSDRIREIGQEMGASCREGAETYHLCLKASTIKPI